jgi:hypothetical protein
LQAFLLGEPLRLFAEIFLGRIFWEPLARPMRRVMTNPFLMCPTSANGQEKVYVNRPTRVGLALSADGWPPDGRGKS